MVAVGIHDHRVGRDQAVAAERLHAGDRERGGEFVAGDDRAGIGEALVTVHDAREVDAAVRLVEQLLERPVRDHDREGGRRDQIGVTRGAGGFDSSKLTGLEESTARANSRTFSRPTW